MSPRNLSSIERCLPDPTIVVFAWDDLYAKGTYRNAYKSFSCDAMYLIKSDLASELAVLPFDSKLLILERKWWNWQTHHLEGVAPKGVGVQIPPSAPEIATYRAFSPSLALGGSQFGSSSQIDLYSLPDS